MQVTYSPMTENDAEALWEQSATDAAWPSVHRDRESFLQFVRDAMAAAWLDEGCMECIWADGQRAGYHVLHRVAETYCDKAWTVVECGTWLLSAWRGRGVNAVVKARAIQLAMDVYKATHCVFAIPVQNKQAIRGLEKLNLPWTVYRSGEGSVLERFIRRKQWEIGQSVVLYVLAADQSETAEPGRVLNPAGDESHFVQHQQKTHGDHQPSTDF